MEWACLKRMRTRDDRRDDENDDDAVIVVFYEPKLGLAASPQSKCLTVAAAFSLKFHPISADSVHLHEQKSSFG